MIARSHNFKTIFLVVFLALFSAKAIADASTWLMKMNHASAEVNFSGTFVYVHGGKVESMEVARRITNGMMEERLYSLNGSAREIIRGMDKVWCYIPDENVAVHDYRQSSESGFPKILPDDLSALEQNYTFNMGEIGRIANRVAVQIRVKPKDAFRYGYDMWLDEESGLLLRSDLLDQNGDVVEQYMFIEVTIGGVITDKQLAAVSKTDELQLFGNSMPSVESSKSTNWHVMDKPNGYKLTKHIRRMSPMEAGEVEHLIFTDGLSTVSIFIKEAKEGQSGMVGLTKMGSVHAFRKTLENHDITVMGEVPADTVEYLAQHVEYTH